MERHFPNRYVSAVAPERYAVVEAITKSNCACGDKASVVRELQRIARAVPPATRFSTGSKGNWPPSTHGQSFGSTASAVEVKVTASVRAPSMAMVSTLASSASSWRSAEFGSPELVDRRPCE